MGEPYITVEDGNFENRGELLLKHKHEGYDLDERYTRETLRNVHRIWNRPVVLATREEEKPVLHVFDGREHKRRNGED